jgi:hypothetical protein
MYSQGASSRWPFKYAQSYDCVVMLVEIVVVNYCSILPCLIIIVHVQRPDFQY